MKLNSTSYLVDVQPEAVMFVHIFELSLLTEEVNQSIDQPRSGRSGV